MTILEAINTIDSLKSNIYTQHDKIRWLSEVDSFIYNEIISTHEDGILFSPYTDDTPLDTELIAPCPYDNLYISFLEAKTDYYNGETNRYNNSIANYDDAYNEFAKYYNRTHDHKMEKVKYF